MYYVFQNKAEAEEKVNEITAAYFSGRPNGDWVTSKYCEVVECNEGYAIVADNFTSKYIQGTPQEITQQTDI